MKRQVFVWAAVASVTSFGCGDDGLGQPGTEDDLGTTASSLSTRILDPGTQFFVPAPQAGAVQQVVNLVKSRNPVNAARIAAMALTPQAVWVEGGTPPEIKQAVKRTMAQAALQKRVPVLVTYNIPFRDCAQYSAGGAKDTAEYTAWIDAVAEGIGKGKAVVILEPDSVGIIPYNKTIYGAEDWCKPTIVDQQGNTVPAPGASPTERYYQLNYAVDSIESKAPNALVYLDATHSSWLGTQEAAYRLIQAGVNRAEGFFINASNYQLTSDAIQFGTWVSDTITAAVSAPSWAYDADGNFHFDWMPSQYEDQDGDGIYQVNFSPEWVANVDAGLATYLNGATATTRFVIDTSRNGRGPLDAAQYAAAPFNQPAGVISALNAANWCNPPGAGLGLRPSANTGVPLLDAYLWIKTPGESDGSCDIAGGARAWDYTQFNPWGLTGDAQNHFDPLWGRVDPAAGAWFPEQALELAQNATPPLF
jgi:endoglucanase